MLRIENFNFIKNFMKISDLNLKIFADGADKETIKKLNKMI